ncbi:hypothetical protein F4781DRAFT_159604 [Annulohypoxylon bovei var. microspora]|nr:hypothetical protein F4781DRAFT_159604 [Annulohypoxylon bovei var. microspora]
MGSGEFDEKNSPTLTHAPTVSDTAVGEFDKYPEDTEKFPPPLEPSQHLQVPSESGRLPMDQGTLGSLSKTESREQNTRFLDDLTVVQAEQHITQQESADLRRAHSKTRSHEIVKEDVFNQPAQAPTTVGLAPEPPTRVNKALLGIKKLPRVVRYFLYSLPVTTILLVPVLLGGLLPQESQAVIGGPGGVQLMWFGIWLEVVWLSLWAARIITAIMPILLTMFAKILSGNAKKWNGIGRQLELHTALFLWMLAVLISYYPILNNHKVKARVPEEASTEYPDINWIDVVNKIITAVFVLAILNFFEKIFVQWVAATFHRRTYSSRIETNKQSIAYLVHLYEHSKDRLVPEASVMNDHAPGSGTRTPMALFSDNARDTMAKVGDIANRVAGDFTGREVRLRSHPRKVVSELLRNTNSAQVLARRLFRTYAKPGIEVLFPQDLNPAFPTPEDAESAFNVFDRDFNGDVSMEELEAFCDEVHREKKAIAASLKDLDSVIKKLDRVFVFVCVIIAALVFVSIISTSTASALASLGTAVLGLAWVLQATAQEFLQSIIFVFVKHPFDVGDRVTVYGNTGSLMRGDDYYVTEISLLYTEFKKMEGHIVQAPNSILNTLFILNHRRSGQLADVFELRMKYGTPGSVIKELENRMTEYVQANKRDFMGKILTELKSFEDAYCMTVNLICFHKTSFQNELLRLVRHNKFAIELMEQMVALGIEQPRRQYQIAGRDWPVFQSNIQPPSYEEQNPTVDPSILTATRRRANSHVTDTTGDVFQDVFVSRRTSNPVLTHPPPIREEPAEASGALPGSSSHLEKFPSNGSAGGRSSRKNIFHRSMTLRKSADRSERDRDIV